MFRLCWMKKSKEANQSGWWARVEMIWLNTSLSLLEHSMWNPYKKIVMKTKLNVFMLLKNELVEICDKHIFVVETLNFLKVLNVWIKLLWKQNRSNDATKMFYNRIQIFLPQILFSVVSKSFFSSLVLIRINGRSSD